MRRIDMIGSPIAQARSPGILNPMLRARGDGVEVMSRDVGEAGLPGYVASARIDPALAGMIVTTPLKQPICAYLDHASALVGFIGACNCVRASEAGWIGANFDGIGFVKALTDVAGDVAGKRVVLVGCGGAGSAIAAGLVASADVDLSICDVALERTRAFVARLRNFAPRSTIRHVETPVGVFDIVVHATRCGLAPGDPSPIPVETIAAADIVVDIVVEPDTAVKRDAIRLGRALIEGEAMVAAQAELFRRFILGNAATESAALGD
jgi:shikimate 5-dehydrogenase